MTVINHNDNVYQDLKQKHGLLNTWCVECWNVSLSTVVQKVKNTIYTLKPFMIHKSASSLGKIQILQWNIVLYQQDIWLKKALGVIMACCRSEKTIINITSKNKYSILIVVISSLPLPHTVNQTHSACSARKQNKLLSNQMQYIHIKHTHTLKGSYWKIHCDSIQKKAFRVVHIFSFFRFHYILISPIPIPQQNWGEQKTNEDKKTPYILDSAPPPGPSALLSVHGMSSNPLLQVIKLLLLLLHISITI